MKDREMKSKLLNTEKKINNRNYFQLAQVEEGKTSNSNRL